MANPSSSSSHHITEEREEGHTFSKTHFLKPVASSSVAVAELPRQRLSVSSPSESEELLKRLSSRRSVSGFWFAERRFVSWAGKMEALHEPTWRKAGIFEAIKASTYNIVKNPSLLLSVSQKWCPETNSFLFPWGEATITLEDVMVLLGFSVLGSPVSDSVHSGSEMEDAVEKLEKALQETKAGEEPWSSRFLDRGDLEHEAFLVLWLSLYVFPERSRRSLSKRVVPIAVRLARGERIALAPAVLAGVYRDLGLISGFGGGECDGKLNFRSLLKLVQVWTWERFKNVRPKAREIPKGEPRIAQWDSLQQRHKNVRLRFDDFEWRPYTKPLKNWDPLKVYVEEAQWVTVDKSLGDEFASFVKCMRVSQLAGDGFVESYYPNRVAMQFGLAQDLPGSVTSHRNFTEKEAWIDYHKPLDGLKLYIPSRLARGSVTERYRDWWVKAVSGFMSCEEMQKETTDDDEFDVSPKVLPLSQLVENLEEGFPATRTRSSMRRLANKDKIGELVNSRKMSKYQSVQMKRSHEESSMDEEEEEDNMTIAKIIRSRKKCSDKEKSGEDAYEPLGKRRRKFQVMDSDDDSEPCQKLASVKIEERNDDTGINIQQHKTSPICDVNGDAAGKKSMIADVAKKAECWLHEEREKKRCNEKRREDILGRLKQRNPSIKEKELKLEARIMEVEKTLLKIREWNSRGNKIKTEASA